MRMDICCKAIENPREIYNYMNTLRFPYARDVDGEGRRLFATLETVGAYRADRLAGFVQYGRLAIGFNESGRVTSGMSYPIICQLYFAAGMRKSGAVCWTGPARCLIAKTGASTRFSTISACPAMSGMVSCSRAFRSSMKTSIIPPC